jgi:hypothetical protein
VPPDPLPRQASWTVRKDRGLRRSSLAALLAAGCLASPPREVLAGDGWRVRADSAQEAREVGVLLEGLRPRLLAALPDSSLPPSLEVWMQDRPHLYALPIASTNEAEGLWAEDRSRILIARGADDIERTLAHEMTHAALGPSWRTLPGSLEEGLCDAVAARLCPGGSARLRAGRLSSAALALGGLKLTLELNAPGDEENSAQAIRARIVLSGEEAALAQDEHLRVFRVQAGLSSTRIEASAKRSYYGLSYLVVERILERVGFEGLHEMCATAEREGLSSVPYMRLLAAADLGPEREDWWQAALQSLGHDELVEIVRMYPEFVVDTLEGHLIARSLGESGGGESGEGLLRGGDPEAWRRRAWRQIEELRANLSLHESGARVDVTRLDFIRGAMANRLDARLGRARRAQFASAQKLQ